MNDPFYAKLKRELEQEILSTEERLRSLKEHLRQIIDREKRNPSIDAALLREPTRELAHAEPPRVVIADACLEGMQKLKEFTKRDLDQWIRNEYPGIDFSIKSLDKSLRETIAKGKLKLLKENIGNKFPAIYKWIDK